MVYFILKSWRRQWHPLQYSCLENPRDGGAWWAAIFGVTQSRTRLKRLSNLYSPHFLYNTLSSVPFLVHKSCIGSSLVSLKIVCMLLLFFLSPLTSLYGIFLRQLKLAFWDYSFVSVTVFHCLKTYSPK